MLVELVEKQSSGTAVRLLSRQAVCDRVGMGKTKLYAMVKDGKFPKCHHIDVGIWRWRSDEVEAWINDRAPAAA